MAHHQALRDLAKAANEAYYAFEEFESSVHDLKEIPGQVKKVLALRLSPDEAALLHDIAKLAEAISAMGDTVEQEAEEACWNYAHALTGLNRGDIVDVDYPVRAFRMRIDGVRSYLYSDEEDVVFYGLRILKTGKPGKRTESLSLGSGLRWTRVEPPR